MELYNTRQTRRRTTEEQERDRNIYQPAMTANSSPSLWMGASKTLAITLSYNETFLALAATTINNGLSLHNHEISILQGSRAAYYSSS